MSMITAVVAAFDASTKHLRGTVNAEKTHCKHGHELAGGSSTGALLVPGIKLVVAANHWDRAVETHAAVETGR